MNALLLLLLLWGGAEVGAESVGWTGPPPLQVADTPLASDTIAGPDTRLPHDTVQGSDEGADTLAAPPRRHPVNALTSDRYVLPERLPRRSEAQVVIPADPILAERLRVVHWPGDEGRADRTVALFEREPDLPGLPPGVPSTAVIFLAPDREIFDALTGGRVPHWGAGVAIPSLARIVIPLFGNPWTGGGVEDRTLRHEWAHLGLHEYLDGLRIPRWFDEGYAQWSSGGWDTGAMWRLRVALARGSAPPLDSLSLNWPRDRAEAELAYLLSASAVSFLVGDSGERGIEAFVDRWAETRNFEGSFRRTFGMATGTFETRWIEHVKQRYGWILIFSHSMVFWGVLAVLLLVLFRIRRKRDAERLAALRAGDPPDLPAFWAPPPHPPIGGFEGERRRPVRAPPHSSQL